MLKLPYLPGTSKRSVAVVVVGNTWTTLTRFSPEPLRSSAVRTADLASGKALAELSRWEAQGPIDAVVSVVPPVEAVLSRAFPAAVFVSGEDAPLEVLYPEPATLGPDRLANALAAREVHGTPVLAVDCGTATTFTLVDGSDRLAGGAIAIGLGTARDALAERTARLPAVDLVVPPGQAATDTATALQVGLVHGHAGLIRHLCHTLAPGAPIVLTGGWSALLAHLLPEATVDDHLTARGGKVFVEAIAQGVRGV